MAIPVLSFLRHGSGGSIASPRKAIREFPFNEGKLGSVQPEAWVVGEKREGGTGTGEGNAGEVSDTFVSQIFYPEELSDANPENRVWPL